MIKDADAKNALETLTTEIENLEVTVEENEEEIRKLEGNIEDLEDQVSALEEEVHSLQEQVKSLEEALAEAYLTDEAHNGTTEESNNKLQCGRSADVSNTADDKASN